MESKPPEPLWQPQWNKPVVEKLAWEPMNEEEYRRFRRYSPNVLSHPGYNMMTGNSWNSDWMNE
jgi:hypothetical protein